MQCFSFSALLLLMASAMHAQPGWDPAFNGIGFHRMDSGRSDQGSAVIANQQSTFFSTIVQVTGPEHFTQIWKYDQEGNPDSTFGTNGYVKLYTPQGQDCVFDIIQLADGSLMAAAQYSPTIFGGDIRLIKFKPNGTLDSTFGTNGSITHDLLGNELPKNLFETPTNQIIASGLTSGFGPARGFAARYHADGALDTSFGQGGVDTFSQGNTFFVGGSSLGSDQALWSAGDEFNGNSSILVTRHLPDGDLDPAFGIGGFMNLPLEAGSIAEGGKDVIHLPDESVVVAGYSDDGSIYSIKLVKFAASGSIDSSFGTNGVVIITHAGKNIDASQIEYFQGLLYMTGQLDGNAHITAVDASSGSIQMIDGKPYLELAVDTAVLYGTALSLNSAGAVMFGGYTHSSPANVSESVIGRVHTGLVSSLSTLIRAPQWKAYPNPVRSGESLVIAGLGDRDELQFWSLQGRLLHTVSVSGQELITFAVPQRLTAGTYIIRATGSDAAEAVQLVVVD